jgi:hypothetical protein
MQRLIKIAAIAWFSRCTMAASTSRAVTRTDENDRRLRSNPAFLPEKDLIVMEAESVPIASPWKFESNVTGYKGKGFLRFDGNAPEGGPPVGELNYFFHIDTPGQYKLVMRMRSMGGSEQNDCYVRVPGQASYLGEVRKAYIPGRLTLGGEWRWRTKLEIDHDAGFFPEPVYTFDAVGTYELQVWGRSRHLFVDRLIMYNIDSVAFDYAKNLARPESRRVGYDAGPAATDPVASPVSRPGAPVPVPPSKAVPSCVPRPVAVKTPVPAKAPVPSK